MKVNKIEIDAEREDRLDKCLEEILEILRDGTCDPKILGSIMAVRHDLPKTKAIEMVQRAQAVSQQQ